MQSAAVTDRPPETPVPVNPARDSFRTRLRHLLDEQQARIRTLETTLDEQLRQLAEQFDRAAADHAGQEELAVRLRGLEDALTAAERERERALAARRAGESILKEARHAILQAARQRDELAEQLANAQRQLEARTREREAWYADNDSWGSDTSSSQADLANELERLRDERDDLAQRLREAQRGRTSHAADSIADEPHALLRGELARAQAELRAARSRNAELLADIAELRRRNETPLATSTKGFDWEQQKRRLLLELELDAEGGPADNLSETQRQRIREAIQAFDEAVAQRDREIDELKRQLAGQTEQCSKTNAQVDEILDKDEVIRAEREKLAELQQQWRERQRQSEVAISLERAKLARERTNLQEKLRTLEAELNRLEGRTGNGDQHGGSSSHGSSRWLTRLGLRED